MLAKCAAENSKTRRLKRAAGCGAGVRSLPSAKKQHSARETRSGVKEKELARLLEPLLDGGEGEARRDSLVPGARAHDGVYPPAPLAVAGGGRH